MPDKLSTVKPSFIGVQRLLPRIHPMPASLRESTRGPRNPLDAPFSLFLPQVSLLYYLSSLAPAPRGLCTLIRFPSFSSSWLFPTLSPPSFSLRPPMRTSPHWPRHQQPRGPLSLRGNCRSAFEQTQANMCLIPQHHSTGKNSLRERYDCLSRGDCTRVNM